MKLRTITFGFSLLLIGSLVMAAKEPVSKALTNDVVNQQGKVISIEGVSISEMLGQGFRSHWANYFASHWGTFRLQ